MLVLVSYDVSTETKDGRGRLRQLSKECLNFGRRVQNSVFECHIDYSQYCALKAKLKKIIDEKTDSLRFYNLGNNYQKKAEHFGIKPSYNPEEILII